VGPIFFSVFRRFYFQLLRSVSAAVVHCPIEYLKAHQLRARLVASDVTPIPDNLQTLLNTLCPLLATGRKRCVQIAVYRLLEKFISELSSYDGGESFESIYKNRFVFNRGIKRPMSS